MFNFKYQNTTKLIFGKDKIKELSQEIPINSRILVLYGGGSIKKNGVYDSVKETLKDYTIFEFGGIEANPGYETLMKAVEIVKKEKIDFLLAVGGGSVLDGTKFVAIAPFSEGDPWDFLTGKASPQKALPIGSIMTLPATGSESNSGAVITRYETKDKLFFISNLVFPRFAILEPEITYSLPQNQTINGIVDAFVHIMEQYLTFNVNSPVQDGFSETLLKTLIDSAPKILKNPKDYDTRANIMFSATLALNGLIGIGVPQDWTTHMIGHEITARHGLDHAITLAIILPAVMKIRRKQKREKLIQYAKNVWNIQENNEEKLIDLVIEKTENFFQSLGIKTYLSDYNIKENDINEILKKLEEHGMTALGENKDITIDISKEILKTALSK